MLLAGFCDLVELVIVCAVLRGFVAVAGWLLLLMWVGLIVLCDYAPV